MKKNRVQQLYQRYVGGLEPWQIKLAIARLLHFRVPPDCWDDMMQELAMVICEFRFDPARAHSAGRKTVLCRALDNRIRSLARSNGRRLAMIERLGRMAQETEDTYGPDDACVDAEVRQMVAELPPFQQEICRGMMDSQSILKIAHGMGKHYTTIRRHVNRIRRKFAERGFDACPA